jgi:hypothetical protein
MSSKIDEIYYRELSMLENHQRRKTKGFVIRIYHDELAGP